MLPFSFVTKEGRGNNCLLQDAWVRAAPTAIAHRLVARAAHDLVRGGAGVGLGPGAQGRSHEEVSRPAAREPLAQSIIFVCSSVARPADLGWIL